jgi:hypothetical protein
MRCSRLQKTVGTDTEMATIHIPEIANQVPTIFCLPKDITQAFITQSEPIQWFKQLFSDYGLAIIDCDLQNQKY